MEMTQDNVYQLLSTQHERMDECAREIFDEIRVKVDKARHKADYTDFNTKSLGDKLCISLRVTSEKYKQIPQTGRILIAQRVLALLQTLGDGKHPFEFYYTWEGYHHIELVFHTYIDTHGRSIKSLYEESKKDGTSKCPNECPFESDKKDDTTVFKHLSPSVLEELLSKQTEEIIANVEAATRICQTIDSDFILGRYVANDGSSIRFSIQHHMKNDLENASTIARLVQKQLKRLLPEPTWDVEYYHSWVRVRDETKDKGMLDLMFVITHNPVIAEGK